MLFQSLIGFALICIAFGQSGCSQQDVIQCESGVPPGPIGVFSYIGCDQTNIGRPTCRYTCNAVECDVSCAQVNDYRRGECSYDISRQTPVCMCFRNHPQRQDESKIAKSAKPVVPKAVHNTGRDGKHQVNSVANGQSGCTNQDVTECQKVPQGPGSSEWNAKVFTYNGCKLTMVTNTNGHQQQPECLYKCQAVPCDMGCAQVDDNRGGDCIDHGNQTSSCSCFKYIEPNNQKHYTFTWS